MKKIKYLILTSIISSIFFFLSINYLIRIGEIVNKFFPCVPCEDKVSPEYLTCTHEYYKIATTCTFSICPCFEIYDVIFMFLMIIIFVISILVIVFKLIKNFKK